MANALAQAGQDEQLQRIFNDGALAAPPGSTYDQAPAGPQFPHLQGVPQPMPAPPRFGPPGQPDPLQDGALMAAPMFPSLGGGQVEPQELGDFQQEEPEYEMPEVSVTAPRDFTPGPHGPPGPREEEGGFMQRVGRWMQPGSPTAMSLLSAGLGILANNTGHYGQAGPAIGKGGLMGVNTFLQLQRQAKQEEVQRAQMAGQAEQREINNRAIRAQTSREERANAKEVALEALIREMERTPPGPKRDQLERLWAFRSGQGSQYIKATRPGGGGQGTEAERSLQILSDYAAKEQSGQPTTPEEDRAAANALALLQRPRTYVDPQSGNVYTRPAIEVPGYVKSDNRGIQMEDIDRARKQAGIEGRKGLDNDEQKELGALGKAYSAIDTAVQKFKPGYGGMIWGPLADIAIRTGRSLPRSIVGSFKDEASWWMDYARWASVERLAQTGLTMTPAEARNFESWTAVPSDSADIVEEKLRQQAEIIKDTMARRLTGLAASGKNMKEAEGYTGLVPVSPEESKAGEAAAQRNRQRGTESDLEKRRKKWGIR